LVAQPKTPLKLPGPSNIGTQDGDIQNQLSEDRQPNQRIRRHPTRGIVDVLDFRRIASQSFRRAYELAPHVQQDATFVGRWEEVAADEGRERKLTGLL
jgi:hypothetical protein